MEEEKFANISETSSVASGRKSSASCGATQKRQSKAEKLAKKYKEKYSFEDREDQLMDENLGSYEEKHAKKVVHFDDIEGHIELKDLKEKDFVDLIDAKN